MSNNPAFGNQIDQAKFDELFLEGPSQFLVPRIIMQLAKVPQMTQLFGKWKGINVAEQRWADYQRDDWSIRQLPAIQLFESETEEKQAENGFMNGTIRLMALWPANFKRSNLARIPKAFHSAMINFFGSQLAFELLDSLANRDANKKRFASVVPGLNEVGKEISEAKNVEGIVESQLVPVTMIDIRFRIDLRQFYRFLEDDYRTKEQPFERTLSDLKKVASTYQGLPSTDPEDVQAEVDQDVIINP